MPRKSCCKCYSRKRKLKVHTLRHHTDEKESSPKNSLSCAYSSRVFGHSFNFRRHITVCKKKSVEPTKPDMEGMMLEMTSTKRHHRHNLEMGKAVPTLLHFKWTLQDEYKRALKLHQQSQIQHVPVHENSTLKLWQKKIMALIERPTYREVIWVAGQKGRESKTFLQNWIKYDYSVWRVITTDEPSFPLTTTSR